MNIEKKFWDVLHKAKLVEEKLCQGKNDHETGGIFYGLFLSLKIKCCLTRDNYGIKQEHKIFKGLNDSKQLLDPSQYFKMIVGKKTFALLPKSWKKLFNNGIVIPTKVRFCNECNKAKYCDRCKFKLTKNKNSNLIQIC